MFYQFKVVRFLSDGKENPEGAPQVVLLAKIKGKMVRLCAGIYSFKNETFYAYKTKEEYFPMILEALAARDWDRRVKVSYAKHMPHHFPILLKGPADKTVR